MRAATVLDENGMEFDDGFPVMVRRVKLLTFRDLAKKKRRKKKKRTKKGARK